MSTWEANVKGEGEGGLCKLSFRMLFVSKLPGSGSEINVARFRTGNGGLFYNSDVKQSWPCRPLLWVLSKSEWLNIAWLTAGC